MSSFSFPASPVDKESKEHGPLPFDTILQNCIINPLGRTHTGIVYVQRICTRHSGALQLLRLRPFTPHTTILQWHHSRLLKLKFDCQYSAWKQS